MDAAGRRRKYSLQILNVKLAVQTIVLTRLTGLCHFDSMGFSAGSGNLGFGGLEARSMLKDEYLRSLQRSVPLQ